MRRRKLVTIILGIIMVLPLFLGLGGIKGIDVEAAEDVTLMIHKKKMTKFPGDFIQNTGKEMDEVFNDYDPLPDVRFNVYNVTAVFYENYIAKDGKTAQDFAIQEVKKLDETSLGTPEFTDTTDEDGNITFRNVAKKTDKQDAVYLIVEEPKEGVTAGERMVVAFPVYEMTTDGEYTDEELDTIHLYPKNVVETDGSLVINKKGTAEGEALNGAEFIISRKVGLDDEEATQYLSGAAEGMFTWGSLADAVKFYSGNTYKMSEAKEAVKGILEEPGTDGELSIVGFEYGSYTLTETAAPEKAGLIKEDYEFTISSDKISAEFEVENDTSIVEKKIAEVKVGGNSYGIGEAIGYEISTNIPMGIRRLVDDQPYYTKFELVDTHDKALSFIEGTYSLVMRDEEGTETEILETSTEGTKNYSITHAAGTGSITTDSFTVAVTPDYIVNLTPGAKLVFKYQMKLNAAANPDTGFDNSVSVTTSHTTDTSEIVTVKTGGKRFEKVDADATTNKLSGATFIVAKGSGTAREYLIVDSNKEVSWTTTKASATPFTSVADTGIVDVKGLEYGQYTLIETVAPTGYVLPANPETPFTISEGSYGSGTTLVDPADVPNKHKGSLPSTGGFGIVAFVAIGVVAVAGAVLYFTKGRRQIEG
ncbi:SpaH/EbpB family LPXTG-anchored major pilin [Enterococcus sp. 2201sp1_2201st1_B8_2201SCRN_220225]|uniref:SpaH/EbpB family LPXTG-anchored major pilin n=1 Tax=unclassified Enterococcus TaxID=2608891 RepID=UPI0034A4151D